MNRLGCDVSKRRFDCAILTGDRFRGSKVFSNDSAGIEQCLAWLAKQATEPVHVCMEATGSYGDALAEALFDAGHQVSIVNPARVHDYAKGLGLRNKTDRLDARVLARFARDSEPPRWSPPPKAVRELTAMVRRLDAVMQMRDQESNRREVAHASVAPAIDAHLAFLNDHITELQQAIRKHIDDDHTLRGQRDLLTSIPGVGDATVAWLIAELGTMRFSSARQAAAVAGLAPVHRQSGDSVRAKPTLPAHASKHLKKALYWPAITAMHWNPAVAALAERMRSRGKHTMAIIAAAMRKLVHIAFGVLKSGRPFDAKLAGA